MRRRVPPDPHAYHREFGTWRYPADKYVPENLGPPYGRPKFPEVGKREALILGMAVLPFVALGEVLRLVRRDYFPKGQR
jgi:hypothetical protein